MVLFSTPSAANNTIFARLTNRDGVLRPRDQRVNTERSSFEIVTTAAFLMPDILLEIKR
jgi:hypothetical protein